ncbi:MAG: hypothetical protein JXA46_17405 [Dehalococcoidales bacterium]|nr:hypothetical protein [Dehalococcoidales bacterium]
MTFKVDVKTSDLKMINEDRQGLSDARAYVVFYWTNIHGSYSEARHSDQVPPEEVVVSGDTSWQGNALENSTIELHSKVRFPREGIWGIQGNIIGEGWKRPVAGGTRIAIADGTSCKYTTDTASLRPTPQPLDYLKDFDYGYLFDRPYFPYLETGGDIMLNEHYPILIEPDISRAPLIGEEAILTIGIISLNDIPDFSAQVKFWNEQTTKWIPISGIIIGGNPYWQGDLKAREPVYYSFKIKFPEEDSWKILARGNSQKNEENNRAGVAHSIYLTIGSSRSFYGWEPDFSYLEITSTLPPMSTPAPD